MADKILKKLRSYLTLLKPNWINFGIELVLLLAIVLTPFIFSPLSQELFEFPKMIWVYFLAISSLSLIVAKSVKEDRIILFSTALNRPLILYSVVFLISTILSIDIYTSIMGYYSRFHGGLASLLAYITLFYLTLVYLESSTSRTQRTAKLLWGWVIGSLFISAWAIGEHFGYSASCFLLRGDIAADCWVQDVQARVFATFGQPNWLAAYLITTTPLSLALMISNNRPILRALSWLGIVLGYAALWYTYSRSGWIGLAVAAFLLIPWVWRISYRTLWPWLASALIACVLVSASSFGLASQRSATSLESGGLDTSTGQIRLLVWQGSLDTIADYPLFGSGPETFPYSFLANRPSELNQTTEWNFLYNKAHNEILQVAVTTGVIGLLAWASIYIAFANLAWKQRLIALRPHNLSSDGMVSASLVAGIAGVFVAQLLGFSVVITGLYFWLALAIVIIPTISVRFIILSNAWRNFLIAGGVFGIALLFLGVSSYYFAEVITTHARAAMAHNPWQAEQQLNIATKLNPFESSYQQQYALANAYLAQINSSPEIGSYYAGRADQIAQQAYKLNPHHILNLKGLTSVYRQLTNVDQKYLANAINMAENAVALDKNDANAQQALAQLYLQNKQHTKALNAFNLVLKLRPSSANSYLQRAEYYLQTNQNDLALQDVMLAKKIEPNNFDIESFLQRIYTN